MPCILKFRGHPVGERHFLVVADGLPERKSAVYVLIGVQGLSLTAMRFLAEDSQTVAQNKFRKVLCRRGGVNGPAKPVSRQLGDAPRVVKVGVRHKKSVNVFRIIRKRLSVFFCTDRLPLKKPAVNEDFRRTGVQEKIGARYRSRSAMKCEG